MDEIDLAMLDAWERVTVACRADPAEARRRWRRSRLATWRKPPSAWCLKLRASDTRIRGSQAFIDASLRGDPPHGHDVAMSGIEARYLCAPVMILWPGAPLWEAARMLGRHKEALREWMAVRQGRTRKAIAKNGLRRWEQYTKPGKPLNVTYEPPAPHGHFGYDVPIVWTTRPIDPGARRGDPPHPVWGTMWGTLSERIDESARFCFRREPRYRKRRGGVHWAGYDWVCPGRAEAGGGWRACGKRVQTLYYPLPVSTIAHHLGDREAGLWLDDGSPDESRLRLGGLWVPGMHDERDGIRSFACSTCWGVRGFSLTDYRGWNDLVSYLSGGLLYGHEVERPAFVVYERKIRKSRRRRRSGPEPTTRRCATERRA